MSGSQNIEIVGGILDGSCLWVTEDTIRSGYLIVDETPTLPVTDWSKDPSLPSPVPPTRTYYPITLSKDGSHYQAHKPRLQN